MSANPSPTGGAHARTLEPRRGVTDLGVLELVRHRDLLGLFVARELKLRYTQTLVGPFWLIANPLVPALLFTFVFTRVVKVDTGGISYLVLVTSALIPWNSVSRALGRGGGALVSERQLLSKVYMPRLIIPFAQVLAVMVDLVVSLAIALVVVVTSGDRLSLRLLVLPLLVVWTIGLATGITVGVAGLSVRYRDLMHAVPFLTQVWLYLSPVVFPVSKVPAHLRPVMRWNPMSPLVQAYQWAVTGTTTLPLADLVAGLAVSGAVLWCGLAVFSVRQRSVADEL